MRLPFATSMSDHWRRKRRAELLNASLLSSQPSPARLNQYPAEPAPEPNLAVDPVSDLARAEEEFGEWQLQQGRALNASGLGPQTAAEELQMRLAREYDLLNPAGMPVGAGHPSLAPILNPGVAPHNDPLSTVPGTPFKVPGG